MRWRAMPISYSLIMCTIRKDLEKWRREGRPRTEYPDSDKGGAEAFSYQREDHLWLLEQAVPESACGAGGRPLCRACHL